MIKKYKKKPVVIEAVQWTGDNRDELMDFAHNHIIFKSSLIDGMRVYGPLTIETLEGTMRARKFDYVIKGVDGEFYPCKREIFEKTYEEIE